jgi:hypothetical protein
MRMISNFARILPAVLAAVMGSGSISSAQQAAPSKTFAEAVKINVCASKPAKSEGAYMYEKIQKIILRVKFSNADLRQAFEGYTAIISVFGQSAVDSKVKKILLQEQAVLSLPCNQSFEHVCEEVSTEFDKRFKYGYYYDGWIVVVKDSSDKVVLVKASSTTMEKLPEAAANLELKKFYNPKLQPVKPPLHSDM